jgi:hypothetical protein
MNNKTMWYLKLPLSIRRRLPPSTRNKLFWALTLNLEDAMGEIPILPLQRKEAVRHTTAATQTNLTSCPEILWPYFP